MGVSNSTWSWEDEIRDMLSFAWRGTKKHRYSRDKWSLPCGVRLLKDSQSKANAILTGNRQLDKTGKYKLIAVDLDIKDNWREVLNTYKNLDLPDTLTVRTPSGGLHLFFWIKRFIRAETICDERHCKHFELKGDNNNITAPGSVFKCGSAYKVILDVPIARLTDDEALRLLKPMPRPKRSWGYPTCKVPKDEVEKWAYDADNKAHRISKGFQIRCPFHDDKRASAIVFNNGFFYCSGCGVKKYVINYKKD